MKIRVLGASGLKVKGRYLTGFHIDQALLLDPDSATAMPSPDEQAWMEKALLFHGHFDHLRDFPFLAGNLLIAG